MTNISSRPRPRSWSDLAPSPPLPAWQCLNQMKLEPGHFIDPCGNYNNYDNKSRVVPAAAPRKWFARTGNPRTRGDSERPIRGELIEFRLFCYSGRGRGGGRPPAPAPTPGPQCPGLLVFWVAVRLRGSHSGRVWGEIIPALVHN